ncbi:MAG TPA: response regulator transcription factor [Albitalea sp.]
MNANTSTAPPSKATIMVVDDDAAFATTLANVFERRGYATKVAHDFDSAIAAALASPPEFAVIDLRLPGGSGLKLVKRLREIAKNVRMVVLTGFGSIATTVDAIKLGAVQYLTKPAHADEVLAALHQDDEPSDFGDVEPVDNVPSVYRVEWEHIHRVLAEQNGNISESARLLGIHRRTLQRKLNKHPVRR